MKLHYYRGIGVGDVSYKLGCGIGVGDTSYKLVFGKAEQT